MNEKNIDKFTFAIIDEFEEFLNERNITIPDDNREGNLDEARIYGSSYYELEEHIKSCIGRWIK